MNHHPRSRFERRMYLRDERTRRRARRRTYKRVRFRPHVWRTIRRTFVAAGAMRSGTTSLISPSD